MSFFLQSKNALYLIFDMCTVFRYFRLLQTGPNSSGTLGLFIGGLEFYGTLTENIQKLYFFDQNITDIIL